MRTDGVEPRAPSLVFVVVLRASRDFANPPALHSSLDGVSADNDENEIYVGFLPNHNLAAVLPIQVAWLQFRGSEI